MGLIYLYLLLNAVRDLFRPQGHKAIGRIMSMKNRTCDLPASR